MRTRSIVFIVLLVPVFAAVAPRLAPAQDAVARTSTDSRGKPIAFPLGASFADEIVSFTVGTPPPRDSRWADPRTVLGPLDHEPERVDPRSPANVVLGCGGDVVARFTDNTLIDIASVAAPGQAFRFVRVAGAPGPARACVDGPRVRRHASRGPQRQRRGPAAESARRNRREPQSLNTGTHRAGATRPAAMALEVEHI
jgi:hypothetical protein